MLLGVLYAHQAKGRKAFSFVYNADWLQHKKPILLDPDVGWYGGPQYPTPKENFGVFLDAMPDRWGRTLMKRRSIQKAREKKTPAPNLYGIDFLLGVQDKTRIGGLRFKLDKEGPFLDSDTNTPVPPISSLRQLQYAAELIESDDDAQEIKEWLALLIAPGSSLGGARPKANVLDANGHLHIAKFPSKHDDIDKGAWEYLAYQLALKAGIQMSPSQLLKVNGPYHTFITKRFDRILA